MLFPPDVRVTSDTLWRGAVIFLLLDSGFVFLLLRHIKAVEFRKYKWTVVITTFFFWGLMWTAMMSFFWEPVYHYVFPEWSRWLVPPVYALFFGLIGLVFWWLALRLPRNPVIVFLLLGGIWGSLSHVWAISRGILEKPPMLQGVSPASAIVLPFFEFLFYWCIILAVSALVRSRWSSVKATTAILLGTVILSPALLSQTSTENKHLDNNVRKFLDDRAGTWHELNVPASDGKILYDIIIKNHYTSALEIGTSTGHSSIWIAWALGKTGGKLITIEIDESRHEQAVANFKAAGLSEFIDARLADAHGLVKELPGPFDFVFSDADKDWYKQYFIDLDPKLIVNGCFTAHNVSDPRRSGRYGRRGGTYEYASFILALPNYETSFNDSGAGLSISYKKTRK